MLRETFVGLASNKQAHIDDHLALHRGYNGCIYADDYATLPDAVAAAETAGISLVKLNPTATYTLAATLVLPQEVVLDGGGRGYTSLGGPRNRAQIATSAALDPMISLGNYSGVQGCYLNGNNVAAGAIGGDGSIYNTVNDNLIARCPTYGIKLGGVLYFTAKRNFFSGITAGYAIDALNAYSSNLTSYYGVNVGLSEGNQFQGVYGAIRVEGILTSINDDFENSSYKNTDAYVVLGGTVQSTLMMYTPYFEMKRGTQAIKAIRVAGSCQFMLHGAQAYGHIADPDGVFLQADYPATLTVVGCRIGRFTTVFAGVSAINSNYVIIGNYYLDAETINAMIGMANCESALCVWPGDRIGV